MLASSPRARRGSALIEVLVALVLLATAGTAMITLLGQTAHSMRTTLQSEQLVGAASSELNRLTVMPRAELLAHLGRESARGWTVDVAQLSTSLIAVAISQSDSGATLLHTTIYRPPPDTSDASR